MTHFFYKHRSRIGLGLLLLWLGGNLLHANPTGGSVVGGNPNATISGQGTSLVTINQTSANAFINWQTFNIGAGETTTFNQPSASSVAWNQINDANPSQILGNLNANGYVVLQNANGFYIGGQAAITTHGLVMTTAATPALNLSSSGPWSFNTPPPKAQIINYGQINITGGGSVYLIASDIENRNDPSIGAGTISAPGGKIGLYAGQTVLVSTSPDGRGLSAQVTLPQGSVDNEGKLIADGGSIAAQAQMVNQNGLVQANTAQNINGVIELVASGNLNLGASSVVSANGDPAATTTPSPGGFVVLNAANNTFADAPGSTISVSGTAGGQNGVVEIFGNGVTAGTVQSTIGSYLAYLINPGDLFLSTSATTPNTQPADSFDLNNPYAILNLSALSAYSQIDLQALNGIELDAPWTLPDASAATALSLTAGGDITLGNNSIMAGKNWSADLTAGRTLHLDGGFSLQAPGGISLQAAAMQTQNGGDISLTSAQGSIELNAPWALVNAAAPATVSLSAGNDITFGQSSDISAGQNWSVNLTAGTGFVPTTAQPTPASGNDGIYLYGSSQPDQQGPAYNSYIQTQNGNINLSAANEVQVGWSGSSLGPGLVNSGQSSVTTVGGGNINVTTEFGDVNAGSDPAGYKYHGTQPYTTVDPNLGGISTAAGGNVTIAAGGNVISYLPSGSTSVAAEDGGVGAFGPGAVGNVTITAGGNVYGHYVVADGTGAITAGQNVGAANGNPFALSLMSGGWNVNALNGNIFLQEVRNPNGDFNNQVGHTKGGTVTTGQYLFNYGPQDYVDLIANGVYLTSLNVPRPFGAVPVLYPPILKITAGSGGVTLEGNVTLFPSPDQNLDITTTGGGNFTATDANSGTPWYLMMSDSDLSQWSGSGNFGTLDHGTLQNEPNESTPVLITISGSMENLDLITTKVTDITVIGDMDNCGFSGQNLQASDHTVITVMGQIFNTGAYSFVNLNQAIPDIPASDLLLGMADSWDDIFTLAVDPTLLPTQKILAAVPVSQWAATALESASLFGTTKINGQLAGINPGFVYNLVTGRLGYAGPMPATTLQVLTQPISILHLVNGQAVIDENPGDNSPGRTYGQIETDTISWAAPAAVQSLFNDSQGRPSLVNVQLGDRVGGPGWFDINAGSISLGNSYGILSCGDYDAAGGFNRYANLAPITPVGATVDVTVNSDYTDQNGAAQSSLNMLTSTIAALGGGSVNVTSTGGSMELGSTELFATTASSVASTHLAYGIYSTGGGDVNVTALGDVNIEGSRIASYNGGNITVESLQGDVNVGNGTADLNTVFVAYVDPVTGQAANYTEDVFGSGIIANTLVPPQHGVAFPANSANEPGNITVITPQGDIVASTGGILQEALDGSITPGPAVGLFAGTPADFNGDLYSDANNWNAKPPLFAGNIDLGNSGVIGGAVTLKATGDINGQIVSRQNSTVTAGQNFSGTLLSAGSANVSGGGTVSGTIIGVGGANVSGAGGVTASVLGQNVTVAGKTSDTLGSSATATASTQSAAQQASQAATQQVASDDNANDDEKKKKKAELSRTVGRVTVILPKAG